MTNAVPLAIAWAAMLFAATTAAAAGPPQAAARKIPSPLPDHPGNVFLAGERLAIPVPAEDAMTWSAVDYGGATVAEGTVAKGRLDAGPLPIGWYEILWGQDRAAGGGHTSAAVLAPLKVPTPVTSPIGIDVAMAWFYKEDRMAAAANLCTLAGVNWVRDRLSWPEMEPERGRPAAATKYDASARLQSAAGLRVLQVNHISPPWAGPNRKRFPTDLADAYRFHREMARRWAGQVAAFEPWNEADIDVFGGHTGAEMASFQKASSLGLKAGNPRVLACLNVFATPSKAILRDLDANQAWPYFDTFNLHHYAPTDRYPAVYAEFRAVSAGRPLWVTEFSTPVKWAGDEKRKEPSPADLKVQAERVAQVFAASLHEGPAAAFYFLLPHYVEGPTQFGILRPDLTPRPAYVALAAVGRLLADARPVGKVAGAGAAVRAFLFRAAPDGKDREVLVAWTVQGHSQIALPVPAQAVYDHLGGRMPGEPRTVTLGPGPMFAVLPVGTSAKFTMEAPPGPAAPRLGDPSPVVLQAAWPKERVDLSRSAYRLAADGEETIPVYVYNFSDEAVEGTLRAEAPEGWPVRLPERAKVGAGGKTDLALALTCRAAAGPQTVRITGDFGRAGRPVLSLQILPEAKPPKP